MLDPLQQWYCDVCGEVIDNPDAAYVIWRDDGELDRGAQDFKIIHRGDCDVQDYPNSSDIAAFLGPDGLTKLLSFLSPGPLKAGRGGGGGYVRVSDFDGYVDFVRRVQVPYYEEARRRFSDPELIEDYSDANEVLPYLVDTLRRISGGST